MGLVQALPLAEAVEAAAAAVVVQDMGKFVKMRVVAFINNELDCRPGKPGGGGPSKRFFTMRDLNPPRVGGGCPGGACGL